jgi:hypothetical protein
VTPTTTSIICRACNALVAVTDKTVATHQHKGEECPMSGMRHVPSRSWKLGAGAPSVELLGMKPLRECSSCGESHGMEALFKMSPGTFANN